MKVRALTRHDEDYQRQNKFDVEKTPRNKDPALHPFEKAREYTRALNAVKLKKVFAKPFIGALNEHSDGVYRIVRHPKQLPTMISGACDGEVRVWSLSSRKSVRVMSAHKGFVRGLAVLTSGESFLSAGDDKIVKLWSLEDEAEKQKVQIIYEDPFAELPPAHYDVDGDMDHHRNQALFATSGASVEIWEHSRLCYNAEVQSRGASDRNIVLYDLRGNAPIKKLILSMRTNALAWNPMEAFNFTTASEDNNCYTFDMRKLDKALNVHQDHVSAVLDIDYSPTGQEFVTGSYDRTVRIFKHTEGHSREIYHTKRMQRIFSVRFTGDAQYVLSGSDDTNIRIWKAEASQPSRLVHPREQAKLDYDAALIQRYKHLPEIKRIDRHRHLPKPVYKAQKTRNEMQKAAKRRDDNRRRHSKRAAEEPRLPARKKQIIETES